MNTSNTLIYWSLVKFLKKLPESCRGLQRAHLRINYVLRFDHHNYGLLNPQLRFRLRFWEKNRKHSIIGVRYFRTFENRLFPLRNMLKTHIRQLSEKTPLNDWILQWSGTVRSPPQDRVRAYTTERSFKR